MKHIREATDKEIEEMGKEIKVNLYNKYYYHWHGGDSFCSLNKGNDGYWFKYFTILDEAERAVGLIQISRKTDRAIAHLGFIVYEEYSGKGYGTNAIKEILGMCRSMGINNLILTTSSKSLCKYYEKFGFKVVGVLKDYMRLPNFEFCDWHYLQLILNKPKGL